MKSNESIRYGIDLGTTNSVVSIVSGNDPRVLKSKYREGVTPSAVFFLKSEISPPETEVGIKAKQRINGPQAARVVTEFKTQMGNPDWSFGLAGSTYQEAAYVLSGRVLRELKNSVKTNGDLPAFKAAVITVPAVFNNAESADTIKAGKSAGIDYVELLAEPVAAALAYGRKVDTSHNPIWLTYDLGGGTFDVALVRAEDGVFNIIDHEGNRNLGGKHLDEAIVKDLIIPQLNSPLKEKVVRGSLEWRILKHAAEEAKCVLSIDNRTQVEVDLPDGQVNITLHASQVENLQKKLFGNATLDLCRKLLEQNGFQAKDIEKVVLVGGSTLSPFLRKMIKDGVPAIKNTPAVVGLGIETDCSADPLTAVGEGAAIYAASRRIPQEILQALEEDDNSKAGISVDIQVPAQTREEEVLVAGVLKPEKDSIVSTENWAVVFERLDSAGTTTWQSEPIRVSSSNSFASRVRLEKGMNEFKVLVLDQNRDPVETNSGEFQVLRDISIGSITLTEGIGVVNSVGTVDWFFSKGCPLPSENTIDFKTTVTLKQGSSETAIVVPVVQGGYDKAALNQAVYTLNIKGNEVPVTIPAGSLVSVTLDLNMSEELSVSAYLEDYDLEFTGEKMTLGIDIKRLESSFKKLVSDFELFQNVKGMSGDLDGLIENIHAKNLLEEIATNLEEGTQGDSEPWKIAATKILELQRILDPSYEAVDAMLKWGPEHKRCEENIKMAEKIISETSGISEDWMQRWEILRKEYDEACLRFDAIAARDLAFGDLPDHFKNDKKLCERVGGAMSAAGASGQTSGGLVRSGNLTKN